MNKNSKRKAKLLAKAFTAERKAGRTIVPPKRKRTSPWKGALSSRRPQLPAEFR